MDGSGSDLASNRLAVNRVIAFDAGVRLESTILCWTEADTLFYPSASGIVHRSPASPYPDGRRAGSRSPEARLYRYWGGCCVPELMSRRWFECIEACDANQAVALRLRVLVGSFEKYGSCAAAPSGVSFS